MKYLIQIKLCVLLLCTAPAILLAQSGYLKGYVITNNNDTLNGYLKDRKFVNSLTSWQVVKFTDTEGKKYTFSPEDIKEYKCWGRKKYYTLVLGVESKKTFVQVTEEGPVILYTYYIGTWGGAGNAISVDSSKKKSEKKVIFYLGIQNVYFPTAKNTNERAECFLQINGKPASLMQWRPRDYKKTANVFFGDNPEIIKLIEDGTLNEDDIFAIVKKYNDGK